MSESRRCPQCDAEIPANSPLGLCPRCLLKTGADSQSAAVSAALGPTVLTPPASGFVPPAVEELAPLFPQLEILELLGKGGMGAVYKARQPGLDRLVAVKILPPEISHDPAFAERFQREARALAKLSHPHIVAVYDFGQTGEVRRGSPGEVRRGSPDPAVGSTEGLPDAAKTKETFGPGGGSVGDRLQRALCYIVMEFVEGANLRQAMRTGTLTSTEALAIVPQICEALQFAHDEGIVHRDIKPENILIDKRGRVKIADFGLAKLLGPDASDHSLTATHQVMGTLRYMAPEQMQGSRAVDHRADIYSLGVVFYELLTGELPTGKFAPPSKKVQIDVRLDEIVLRALEADPEQRYQHASDVKSEIDSIRTTPAPPKPVEQRDPLEPFRKVARFAMTPNPGYAKRVGIPMAILFGLFSMVTITAHSVYGQKDNYQEQPLVLILSNGAILLWLAVIILHITFFARQRVSSMKATPTPFDDSGRATPPLDPVRSEVRQRDAKEILSLLLRSLYCMSIAGWGLAFYGGARVLVDGTMPGTRRDVLAFGWCLAGSIVAQVVLHKGWAQGRDRLARLGALNLVAVGGLLSNVSSRWCGVPSWVALIYSLVAFVGYLILRGKDVSAALRDRANQTPSPRAIFTEPRFSRFAIAGAVLAIFGLLTVVPVLYFIGLNRVWNGEALPTDVIHSVPPLVFSIFMGALLAIGAGAPIGTTIFGAISIGHIKRSDGKIIGLPLAFADAIFFPLLVFFVGIAFLVAQSIVAIAQVKLSNAEAPATLVSLLICCFIGRAMWRAIAGVKEQADVKTNDVDETSAPRTSTKWEAALQTWWLAQSNVTRQVLWIALTCLCPFCAIAFLSFSGTSDTDGNHLYRVGFLDPWFVFERRVGPGLKSVSGIFLAWSWLFGIGAYGSGWLLFKFKRWSEQPTRTTSPGTD